MAIYRFRSTENLLDKFHELENQEIYFASPAELNDPMEGYRDIFWRGDRIVWENLLINYLRNVEHIYSMMLVVGETKLVNEQFLSPFINSPTPAHRQLFEKIRVEFFSSSFINDLPNALARRKSPVRHMELLYYLQAVLPFAINAAAKICLEAKLAKEPYYTQDLTGYVSHLPSGSTIATLVDQIETSDEDKKEAIAELFFSSFYNVRNSTMLLTILHLPEKEFTTNRFFLINELPEKYLAKMKEFIFPDWFSASFLTNCKDSVIWGHYGDKHYGVCLMFKQDEKNELKTLSLKTEYGANSSGAIVGMRPHAFQRIHYHHKYVAIDFFRSIGRMTKQELNYNWYKDRNGNFSECGTHLNENEKTWMDEYWSNFYKGISIKLKEWKYEGEYRLIVHGDFVDYSKADSRKLQYDFDSLEGIIFGLKTTLSDKVKIIKIITAKCKEKGRKEFDFYQAYYSAESGLIEHAPLTNVIQ